MTAFVHSSCTVCTKKRGIEAEVNLLSALPSGKKLVDVAGIEPATPCLQRLAARRINNLQDQR